jgi:hypothetical protein
MFSLFAFLGAAIAVDKNAWNVPPHQQLAFVVFLLTAIQHARVLSLASLDF